MKKVLFIDRDGTLALEPDDYQLDAFDKLMFYPQVFTYLGKIAKELDYTLVMVTNQDGLGTDSFPESLRSRHQRQFAGNPHAAGARSIESVRGIFLVSSSI